MLAQGYQLSPEVFTFLQNKSVDEVTQIVDDALKLPSTVVKVITTEPSATPVTRPVGLTVAFDVSLELQITVLLVAFKGHTVSVNCTVAPTFTETDVGDTLTAVTGTFIILETLT